MRRTYYRIGKQDKARRLPIRNREHHPTAAFWILPQPHPVTHLYQQKPDGRPKLAQFTTSTQAATAHRSSQAQIDCPTRCDPVTHLYQQKPDGRPNLAQFTTSTPAATAHRSSQAQIDCPTRCDPVTYLYQQKPDGRPKLAQFTTSTPAATAHRSSQAQIDGSLRCEISGPAWHESKQLIQVISIMYAHVPRPSTFCSIANTRKLSQNPRCGVVFDTRGNKYRLTAEINFRRSVRLGNKEYRKGAWKNSACAASFPRTI